MKMTGNRKQAESPELLKTMVSSPNFSDLMADNLEVLLDQVLRDGLFREIPAIGTAVSMVKAGIDVRNRIFLEKLLRFCNHLQNISEEERLRFVSKLKADEKFRLQVGESLVLLLDRLDDVQQKPVLLARIFEAYIGGRIDHLAFQKLSTALDRIKTYNIPDLLAFYDNSPDCLPPDDGSLQDLVIGGLASIVSDLGLVFGDGSAKNVYKNELGRLFIEIALGKNA